MKTISQERIINALEKIDAACHRSVENDRKFITSAGTLGIRATFDPKHIQVEVERFNLELNFLEIKKDPEEMNNILNRFFKKIKHFDTKRDKIYSIQVKYGISALVPTVTEIGNSKIKHLWEHKDLRIIPSDIPKLAEGRRNLINQWHQYAVENDLDIYLHREEWDLIHLGQRKSNISALEWYEQSWANAASLFYQGKRI